MHSAMMESIYFCISSVNEIVNCFPRFHRNHQITISKFMQSADINFENETNCIPIVFISGFLIIRHFHLRFNVVFGHSGGCHVLFYPYRLPNFPKKNFSAVSEKVKTNLRQDKNAGPLRLCKDARYLRRRSVSEQRLRPYPNQTEGSSLRRNSHEMSIRDMGKESDRYG